MSREIYQKNFGEMHSKALDSCKNMGKHIDQLNNMVEDSEHFIYEYFNKIKNEIDIHREVTISSIHKHYEVLIKEVERYQEAFSKKSQKDFENQRKIVKEVKSDLALWQSKLVIPDFSTSHYTFENIDKNAKSSSNILMEKIANLKYELLNGNQIDLVLRIEKNFMPNENFYPKTLATINVEKKVNCISFKN